MATVPYNIGQNTSLTMGTPARISTIAGDNPTPGYIHFPSLPPGLQWVFPFTYGFSYPLDVPQASIIVTTSDTPPGFPAAPVYSAIATIVAYDFQSGYSPGRQPIPAGQWSQVGTKTMAGGGDTLTTNIVPPTTKTLAIHCEGAGGTITVTNLQGAQSLSFYYVPTYPAAGTTVGWTMIPVNGARDATYILTTSAGSGGVVSIYATDALIPNTSQGFAGPSRAFPVYVTNSATQGVLPVSIQGGGGGLPSPWLVPNLAPIFKSRAVAGTTAVLAASGTLITYVFSGQLVVAVAAAGGAATLEDLSGNTLAQMRTDAIGQFPFDLSGAPLGASSGLQFTTIGASTSGVVVSASQG